MTLRPFRDQITLSTLLNEDGYYFQLRMVKSAAEAVSIENAVNDMLRVQMRLVNIREHRDTGPLWMIISLRHRHAFCANITDIGFDDSKRADRTQEIRYEHIATPLEVHTLRPDTKFQDAD